MNAQVRGIEREGKTFQGLLCLPLKSGDFLAKMNAPVGGSKGLVGPRSLRSKGPINLTLIS